MISRSRIDNLLRNDIEASSFDHSMNIGRYVTTIRSLKKKYLGNEITLLDIYQYYRVPLSMYTSRKMRNVFVTASLCLTVYITSNMDTLRSNSIPSLGLNFSSAALVVGGAFVGKEIISYVLNLKKTMSMFYIYRYILKSDTESTKFRDIVEQIIRLEKEIHGRELREKDIRYIINHEKFLLLLLMRRFPSIFDPMCSRFLLYILHLYINKVGVHAIDELCDEIRVVVLIMAVLSPVISIFFMLYYVAKIIENSQNCIFYAFRREHRTSFKYFITKGTEYPHETQMRIQRGAKYLDLFFQLKRGNYLVGICSAISFFLSCLIFLTACLMIKTVLTSNSTLNGVFRENIKIFGRKTSIVHLSYFIGGISFCLKCLNFRYATVNRRKAFAKWCEIMDQDGLLKYSRNRKYLERVITRFFVPRIYLFVLEIISPFVVPFQLSRFRRELRSIELMFQSAGNYQEYNRFFRSKRASVLDL
jgi:hypothetical protein